MGDVTNSDMWGGWGHRLQGIWCEDVALTVPFACQLIAEELNSLLYTEHHVHLPSSQVSASGHNTAVNTKDPLG